jgi:hypothetical protein
MRRVLVVAPILGAVALTAFLVLRPSTAPAEGGKSDPLAKAPAPQLPVAQTVLFSSGVGFFQREGEVDGNTRVDLSFPVQDINDLLKSMVLQDHGGGHISAVSYESRDPIDKTLRSFAINLTQNPGYGQILQQARGEKVEIVMQQTAASQPGRLTGTIIGVEKQKLPAGKDGAVEVEMLNLWCAEGMRSVKLADVQQARFLNPVMENEMRRALEILSLSHDTQKKAVTLNFTGEGKRPVMVSYVVENPIWKTSYRLVLGKDGKPFLQGWAVVENPSDEDWNNVRMALVSGRPISFQMDLYQPLYVPRPTVVPELFASLVPQNYDDAMAAESLPMKLAPPAPPIQAGMAGMGVAPGGGAGAGPAMKKLDADKEAYRAERGMARSLREQAARRAGKDGKLGEPESESRRLDLADAGIAAAASAANLGDFFQYVIAHPVNLPRQKSAMLPIVNKDIEASKVSIYNERDLPKHPLLGLRLKNTTGMHLMQGPITVFEENTYAGDSRIMDLPKGGDRLISYAIDLGTEVEPVVKHQPNRITTVKINKGILQTITRLREVKTYNIKNRAESDRLVLLEHPVRHDFKLVSKDQPKERTRDVYRYEVKVPAGKSASQEVIEEQDILSQVVLNNLDDNTIRVVFQSTVASAKVMDAIKKSQELKTKVAETQRNLGLAQRQLGDIERDQTRLRANLKETPPTAAAYKKYLEKLDKQEGEIDVLTARIKELQEVEAKQKKDYDDYLGNLTVE